MTVTNENSRNDYTSNGSAVEYAFTFKILDQEDLEVIITDLDGVEDTLTLDTNYTVELDEDTGLGSITLTTAATEGYTISILRNMDFEQNTSIQNQGSSQFAGKAFEQALDKLTLLSLQLKESIARAILLPKSSLLTELEIPVNSANSGKAIIVNDAGDNLEVKSLADISAAVFSTLGLSLVAAETAAAMRALLSAQALNATLTDLAARVVGSSVGNIPVVGLQSASTGLAGTIEIATNAEVTEGTNILKAIVPAALAASKFNAVNLILSQIASNAASIIFTGLDSSYSVYEFEYINVTPANNGAALVMQFSTDNGINWQNTNYLSDGTVDVTSSAASESQNNARGVNLGLSDAVPALSVSNNATLGGINGWIKIFNPASTTAYKNMKFLSTNIISADGVVLGTALGYGVWKSISAVNAVRFIFKAANSDANNGNIASGTIKMRGYK